MVNPDLGRAISEIHVDLRQDMERKQTSEGSV